MAQFGAYTLGQLLIALIVIVALWAIFMSFVAPKLPPQAMTVINIVAGAIIAIIAVKVLLSFM